MTLPALYKCKKCGANRHSYLMINAQDESGKVCKGKKSCEAKNQGEKMQAQQTVLSATGEG